VTGDAQDRPVAMPIPIPPRPHVLLDARTASASRRVLPHQVAQHLGRTPPCAGSDLRLVGTRDTTRSAELAPALRASTSRSWSGGGRSPAPDVSSPQVQAARLAGLGRRERRKHHPGLETGPTDQDLE